jgi:Family of unknown function (DUF6152)
MYTRILLAAAFAVTAAPAFAHHSAAMFDAEKEITLQGTVREFQYTNPHSWIQVMVPGQDGKSLEWSVETAAPIVLLRAGIKKNSIAPGEKVSVRVHPMKDGSAGGNLIALTKADGSVISLRGGQ